MIINQETYRSQVLGCWMGKNIGGTLGAPFEWRRQVNDVAFYTQDLHGEPLPNDDLDIQLLWLVALEEQGIALSEHTLAEYWLLYVTPHWCEYGHAKINMRAGFQPPLCGEVHNEYKDSCGAFIRSEIWACIAPGLPKTAAAYAYMDAILDHGGGEGTYGEVFCAALESAAFVIKDIPALLDIALTYIPEACGVAQAVRDVMTSHATGKTWREARESLLEKYRGSTHAGLDWCTCADDRAKGFHKGQRGWDTPSNIGITVLGLLYGDGDFGETLCIAVNCGEDTDCTAATAGSIFGILHGIEGIPEKWIAPIGRTIKAACLNIGELGYFGNQLPGTVDNLTERTENIARQVLLRDGGVTLESGAPAIPAGVSPESLMAGGFRESLFQDVNAVRHRFDFFDIAVDYGESPFIRDGEPKVIALTIANKYKIAATFNIHWHLPEGWTISPSADGVFNVKQAPFETRARLRFTLTAAKAARGMNRLVAEFTSEGRPTAMLVPIALMNGNLDGIAERL